MKRNAVVLSLLLLVTGAIKSQAQGFHLGIKGGANLNKMNGQAFDQGFKFGYNVGAFAELNFTPMWGIQPELMFNQSNYRTGDHFSDIYPGGVDDVKGKLNYLTIPILLSFRPIPLLSLQAGPQFGIKLNKDEHLVNNAGDAFKSGDFPSSPAPSSMSRVSKSGPGISGDWSISTTTIAVTAVQPLFPGRTRVPRSMRDFAYSNHNFFGARPS